MTHTNPIDPLAELDAWAKELEAHDLNALRNKATPLGATLDKGVRDTTRELDYPHGFRVFVLRSSRARPRTLALGKASTPHTRRAKRQNVGGHVPYMRTSGL